jgi:hypothetical protein
MLFSIHALSILATIPAIVVSDSSRLMNGKISPIFGIVTITGSFSMMTTADRPRTRGHAAPPVIYSIGNNDGANDNSLPVLFIIS